MGCKISTKKCVPVVRSIVMEERKPVDRRKLKEKGRIHYFYHSLSSKLPIRDVCNEQDEGHKTEPHIEIGAENFCGPCRPSNIVAHLNQEDEKYLFLVTTCKNRDKDMEEFNGKTYIVGYMEKEEELVIRPQRRAVKGKTIIFPFKKSVLYRRIFPGSFTPIRLVGETETKKVLSLLPNADESILEDCVKEIEKLDKKNKKDNKTCFVLRGGYCEYQKECRRWNL